MADVTNFENEVPLYAPPDAQETRVFHLLRRVNSKYGLQLKSYLDLYKWSTSEIDEFWKLVWDDTGVVGEMGSHVIDTTASTASNPAWFKDAKLNWAENMLVCRSADKTALIQVTIYVIAEPTPENPKPPHAEVTYAQLYALVADAVSALLQHSLQAGDRVASYSSNCIENVVACLAATAIGCIWVSAAADFGSDGVLERFEQVQPKLIFTVESVVYNGKVHQHLPKVSALLSKLSGRVQTHPKIVIISSSSKRVGWDPSWEAWQDFLQAGQRAKLGIDESGEIKWERLSFNWPLWILFSSGTTGRPKPIVHRAGGMLLQGKKELAICGELSPSDVFFYYTTTGWMMWNFLVGGLSIGCTLVLYDGSPLRNPSFLWNLTDELGITIFGTSAKYIDQLSKNYKPRKHHRLTTLRHIYSTGSPLAPPLFDYVYTHIHPTVLLGSITGGTDICSLFAGMCTALPVYRGEIQCRLLGMAVDTYTATGTSSGPDESGELVCLRPFPCMPVGFWPLEGFGDEDAVNVAKARYQAAYFAEFKGIWYHGDHVILTRSRQGNGGGLVMLGRSDGVLNPGGVRFGSAELYDVVDASFPPGNPLGAANTIIDCLAVGQSIDDGTDERVILFIKLPEGEVLSEEFEKKIKSEVRKSRSPRHVPARIIQARDVPYTLNGKRVEVPVKKIINGASVSSINPETLRNAECLEEYAKLGAMLREEVSKK